MMGTIEAWRRDPSRRIPLIVTGAFVGLLVTDVHWIGLLVGGALVGMPARSTRWALAYGLGFGVLAWIVFAVVQLGTGIGGYSAATTLLGLSLGMAVVLGTIGASVRALA